MANTNSSSNDSNSNNTTGLSGGSVDPTSGGTAHPTSGGTATAKFGGAFPTINPTPIAAPKGLREEIQHMLQGWQSTMPAGGTLQVHESQGRSPTKAEVVDALQGYLKPYLALDAETLTYRAAHAKVTAQRAAAQAELSLLKTLLIAFFGKGNPLLGTFGIGSRKASKPLTATQRVAKAAKLKATRLQRRTAERLAGTLPKSGPVTVTVTPAVGVEATAAAGSNPGGSVAPGLGK